MEEDIMAQINVDHFRVAIFGSARSKPGDPTYELIFSLANKIAKEGMDIVTGGGPGLMDAASEGHFVGRKDDSQQMQMFSFQTKIFSLPVS